MDYVFYEPNNDGKFVVLWVVTCKECNEKTAVNQGEDGTCWKCDTTLN